MISIEIGSVPSAETPKLDPVSGFLAAAAFLRQLNRVRPLLEESGYRYFVQTAAHPAYFRIVLAGKAGSFENANLALSLAESAQEVNQWDAIALFELGQGSQIPHIEKAVHYA